MALQLKLLVIGVFLLLTTLSFCQAKNSTVKVVGLIHCTDCIKNQSSSSHTSLGFNVLIICKARKRETKTQGNGAVDKEGKFNVTLSDPSSIDGCYAKLQSNSSAPCPIQGAQTASVKILSNNVTKTVMNRPTIIEFSPITCQSAFFWPFPNLTFFASPPPPEYTPPPPPENLPPLASPVQPPLPPPENSTPPPSPQPSYDPPAPEIGAPSSPPTRPPTYQNLPTPTTSPSPPPQAPPLPPPPLPVYTKPSPPLPPPQAPPLNNPIQSPSYTPYQTPPPTPALSPPPAPPLPKQERAIPPPPSAGISTPPSRRRPNPIPRAPPIPRLPLTPSVPRKYFNAPKSKSKPPRYD